MTLTNLFEQHLMSTMYRGLSNEPLDEKITEDDVNQLTAILQTFADGLCPDTDLEEQCYQFAEYMEWDDEDDVDCFKAMLAEFDTQAGGDNSDASIRATLKILAGRPGVTHTNVMDQGGGCHPLPTEQGARAFLKSLPVSKYGDYAGNYAVFQGRGVKTFDRIKNRYGHPTVDYNDQQNKPAANRNLANPTLNIHAEFVFVAADAVGLGMQHQWRVYNSLNNNAWISPMMLKSEAEGNREGLEQPTTSIDDCRGHHWPARADTKTAGDEVGRKLI